MKCSPDEMFRSAATAYGNAMSDTQKALCAKQQNITGPKSLKKGIHMHQIRTKPEFVQSSVNAFFKEMSAAWPTFRIIQVNTNMTFSAMYVYITYEI